MTLYVITPDGTRPVLFESEQLPVRFGSIGYDTNKGRRPMVHIIGVNSESLGGVDDPKYIGINYENTTE